MATNPNHDQFNYQLPKQDDLARICTGSQEEPRHLLAFPMTNTSGVFEAYFCNFSAIRGPSALPENLDFNRNIALNNDMCLTFLW